VTHFPWKFVYSALLGLDSTFAKLHKNVAKKTSHATQHGDAKSEILTAPDSIAGF
jgi:hypothetical protein